MASVLSVGDGLLELWPADEISDYLTTTYVLT